MNKLNVLYVSNNDGGAPMSLFNLIQSVRDRVNPVVLFPFSTGLTDKFVNAGIRCLFIYFDYEIFYCDDFHKQTLINRLRLLSHRFFFDCIGYKKCLMRLDKELCNQKIDIVHTNTGAISIGYYIAKRYKAKHIWHLREFQDKDFNARPFHSWWWFKRLVRKSDVVIAITKAIYNHFDLVGHKKSYILWNAVRSKSEACYNVEKEKYILYASNVIIKGKGLHDLLEAYGKSDLPNKGFILKIAGRISDEDEYKILLDDIIRQYNIIDKIEWLGFCDIKPYMEKATVFVMPSLYEAMGRVAIEAMFYGCPIIARNSGGPSEFMEHKHNGYVFEDIKELEYILNHVISTSQHTIINNAQKFAVENFSEDVYGKKMYGIYKEITCNS